MRWVEWSVVALLLLAACSKIGPVAKNEGTSTHGGDPIGLLFERAKPTASDRVRKVRIDKLDPKLGVEMISWFGRYQERLATDIASTEFHWVSESQTTCARTELKPQALVSIHIPSCRPTVHNVDDAVAVLIHEAIHHFEIEDEAFANRLTNAIVEIPAASLDGIWHKFRTPWDGRESLHVDAMHAVTQFNGEVVVLGLGKLWFFNPKLRQWRSSKPLPALEGRKHAAIAASDNAILIWGGQVDESLLDADSRKISKPRAEVDDYGYFKQGFLYHPDRDAFEEVAATSALSARTRASAFWTGKEFLIWSGERTDGTHPWKSFESWPIDGGKLSAKGDAWTAMAKIEPAFQGSLSFWTGDSAVPTFHRKLVVYHQLAFTGQLELAIYDPDADQWLTRKTSSTLEMGGTDGRAVWTGNGILWLNSIGTWNKESDNLSLGATWNAESDKWAAIRSDGGLTSRDSEMVAWSGKSLFVFGGYELEEARIAQDGGLYDPALDKWWPLASRDAPRARTGAIMTWIDGMLVLLGGFNERNVKQADGAVYVP